MQAILPSDMNTMDMSAMTLPVGAVSPANQNKVEGGKTKAKGKPRAPKDPNAPPRKRKKKDAAAAATPTPSWSTAGGAAWQGQEGTVESGSLSGSVVVNQTLNMGGGEASTPTKRKANGKGSKAKSKRESTRNESRGSRGASARASMSVVPAGGAAAAAATAAPEEGEEQDEYQDVQQDEEDLEDEDEDEEGGGGDQGLEDDQRQRQETLQKARSIAMGPLMKAMDDVQQDRYSVYRRSLLDKRQVKRFVSHLTGQNPTQQVVVITAAVTKIFVGEIIELARKIRQEKNASGPLRPEHLLEANRRYKEEREVPGRFPPGAPFAGAGIGGNGKRRRLF